MYFSAASTGDWYADTDGLEWANEISTVHIVKPTVPTRLTIRCEYCLTKNKVDAPRCEACNAPLPD